MKILSLSVLFFLFQLNIFSQNIGIGISNPTEKLEVNGGIKIGNSANAVAGTIRFNDLKKDFEGFNGTNWVSLSGARGGWGDQNVYNFENAGTAYLLNENTNDYGDYLGSSLSTHGDYLIAGAKADYHIYFGNLVAAGTVHIHRRVDNQWSHMSWREIHSPTAAANENFGVSSAIDGPYFAIGATGTANAVGRVYAYTFDALGEPSLMTSLFVADGAAGDQLGTSVAVTGNFILAGAPMRDISGRSNQGRVSVFMRNANNNTWSYLQHLVVPDGAASDLFGSAISVHGNYAAISAPNSDYNGINDAGKVYIYHNSGANWLLVDSVRAPDPMLSEKFGTSVFIKGDTLVVGAPQHEGSLLDGKGRAFVFVKNGSDWQLQATLSAADGQKGHHFGSSVTLNNGQIVVGAKYANIGAKLYTGKAYMFRHNGQKWDATGIFAASNAQQNDAFGTAVTFNDNMLFISAPMAAVEQSQNNGRIYFFKKS